MVATVSKRQGKISRLRKGIRHNPKTRFSICSEKKKNSKFLFDVKGKLWDFILCATGFEIEFVTCSAIRKIFSTMRILARFHLISIMLGGQSEAFFSL